MRRTILYIIVGASLILTGQMPFASSDVGRLRPVEVLSVSGGESLTIRSDTGDVGRGTDWETAMENLRSTSPGAIFQGTVSFLILEDASLLDQVLNREELNPACGVCLGPGVPDPEGAAAFLRAHGDVPDLRSLRAGQVPIPVLLENEGRFCLVQP